MADARPFFHSFYQMSKHSLIQVKGAGFLQRSECVSSHRNNQGCKVIHFSEVTAYNLKLLEPLVQPSVFTIQRNARLLPSEWDQVQTQALVRKYTTVK